MDSQHHLGPSMQQMGLDEADYAAMNVHHIELIRRNETPDIQSVRHGVQDLAQ